MSTRDALILAAFCFLYGLGFGHEWGKRDADRWWQARTRLPIGGRIFNSFDNGAPYHFPSNVTGQQPMYEITCWDMGNDAWVERGNICHADPRQRSKP